MKKILLITFLLLITQLSFSQWVQQFYDPSLTLRNIEFINDEIGYATADNNSAVSTIPVILKTTDGGANWNELPAINYQGVAGQIQFVNESIGWLMVLNNNNSQENKLLKTTNGGISWDIITTTGLYYLHNFYAKNKDTLFLYSWSDQSRYSTDGGTSWFNILVPGSASYISKINFPNPGSKTGYLINNAGNIYKTTDGGISWMQKPKPSSKTITDVFFTDTNTGYISGYNFIIKTSDGGETWSTQNYEYGTYKLKAFNNGSVYIDKNKKSFDAGKTFVEIAGLSTIPYFYIFTDFDFPSDSYGYGIADNKIFKSITPSSTPYLSISLNQIGFSPKGGTEILNISSNITWSVENTSSDFTISPTSGIGPIVLTVTSVSNNSNVSVYFKFTAGQITKYVYAYRYELVTGDWQDISPINKATLNAIDFVDDKIGFAGGESIDNVLYSAPALYKTLDGGSSWLSLTMGDAKGNITDLQFVNSTTGWAIVSQTENYSGFAFYNTTNSGNSWNAATFAGSNYFSSLYVKNADTLFAFYCFDIAYSIDKGKTWNFQNLNGSGTCEMKMSFVSPHSKTGYLQDGNGRLFKSQDGGMSWNLISRPIQSAYFGDISFISDNIGFISGNNYLIKTSDGGITWKRIDSGQRYSYYNKLKVFNENDIFLGSALKSIDGGKTFANFSTFYYYNYYHNCDFLSPSLGYAVSGNGIFKYQNNSPNDLYLSGTSIILDESGTPETLEVKTSGNWIISQRVSSNFTIMPISGTGNSIITISGLPNTTTLTGYEYYVISSPGNNANIEISQLASTSDTDWKKLSLKTKTQLTAISFCDESNGYVGGNGKDPIFISKPLLAKTTDGGVNWASINTLTVTGEIVQIANINTTTGFVLIRPLELQEDYYNKLYKTQNGGLTWQLINSYIYSGSKLYVKNKDTIFTFDYCNSVSYSTNGGNTWIYYNIEDCSGKFMHFPNNKGLTGYLTSGQKLWKTTDGGISWEQIATPSNKSANDIFFLNDTIGYIILDSKYLIKTTDGGLTWNELYFNNIQYFNKIIALSEQEIYLNGKYKSLDGGLSFFTLTGLENYLIPFDFPSSKYGYAINNTEVYKYANFEVPYLSLSKSKLTFESTGGSAFINIGANNEWIVNNPINNAFKINPMSGRGNAVITVTALNNALSSQQLGSFEVVSNGITKTMSIYQKGKVSSVIFDITPKNLVFPTQGGNKLFTITSNANWNIYSTYSTFELSTSSGYGNSVVTITAVSNLNIIPKGDIITVSISGQALALLLTQDGIVPELIPTQEILNTLTPTFTWTPIEGADTYCLEISLDSNFTSAVFSVCGITAFQYQIPGGSLSERIEALFANGNKYYWRVAPVAQDILGTWSKPSTFTISNATVIKESFNKSISIYPNPNKGGFNIENSKSENLDYKIFNSSGKTITKGILLKGTSKLDLDVEPGLYLIQIKSGINLSIIKFIVE